MNLKLKFLSKNNTATTSADDEISIENFITKLRRSHKKGSLYWIDSGERHLLVNLSQIEMIEVWQES